MKLYGIYEIIGNYMNIWYYKKNRQRKKSYDICEAIGNI